MTVKEKILDTLRELRHEKPEHIVKAFYDKSTDSGAILDHEPMKEDGILNIQVSLLDRTDKPQYLEFSTDGKNKAEYEKFLAELLKNHKAIW